MARFSASLIREVANTAMGRSDVLPFWFGESDRVTPSFIREAAVNSIHDGETFYSENLGRFYLREAIARYLTALHHQDFSPQQIAVTPSGVTALMLTSQLLVEPGDPVVIVTPLWPNAVEIPKIMGGNVTTVPLEVKDGQWFLPMDKLLSALQPGTRMLIINSPHNPTGWTILREQQLIILEHCRRHGIWLVADDVYERLIYTAAESAPSFLTLAGKEDRLIIINSFSKAWCMTGWRLGWIVAPVEVFADLAALLEFNASCVSVFTQRAGVAALDQGESFIAQTRSELGRTKEKLSTALRALPGLEVPEADGAMYLFFHLAGENDSVRLARLLIQEVGLGLAPGRAFGPEGEGWLRWCYASDWKKNEAGVERLAHFLSR
jgi:aspartate/methionine/tyrosine aminotransferase